MTNHSGRLSCSKKQQSWIKRVVQNIKTLCEFTAAVEMVAEHEKKKKNQVDNENTVGLNCLVVG